MAALQFVAQFPVDGRGDGFQFFMIINHAVVSSAGAPPCANGLGFPLEQFSPRLLGNRPHIGELVECVHNQDCPGQVLFWTWISRLSPDSTQGLGGRLGEP